MSLSIDLDLERVTLVVRLHAELRYLLRGWGYSLKRVPMKMTLREMGPLIHYYTGIPPPMQLISFFSVRDPDIDDKGGCFRILDRNLVIDWCPSDDHATLIGAGMEQQGTCALDMTLKRF